MQLCDQFWKKYTSGPRYWNVPVLVNTGTFLVYQYWPEMWYLHYLERAGGIQKQTMLEHQNGLVLSNTRVPVSETWSILFPNFFDVSCMSSGTQCLCLPSSFACYFPICKLNSNCCVTNWSQTLLKRHEYFIQAVSVTSEYPQDGAVCVVAKIIELPCD